MKTKITILLLVLGVFLSQNELHAQTTYIDNGSSSTYTLQTGDSLHIRQGTFTGTINNWSQGGKVSIASGATFRPANVNGYNSKYTVHGTMIVANLQGNGGFALDNYGVVTVNGSLQLNSSAQHLINRLGAYLNISGSFDINAANSSFNNGGNVTIGSAVNMNADGIVYANTGDIEVGSNFNMYSNSTVVNKKSLSINGNFNANKGQVTNEGRFFSTQTITLGGNVVYTNTCRTIANNGITINNSSASIYNSGILLAANASAFTNSATIINTGNAAIKSGVFTNYGAVRGNGYLYITGKSTLGSGATVGTNGSATDSIRIYTVNRTKTTQIFDDQWGTVYPAAKYAQFTAPDTTGFSAYACATEYTSLAILPATVSNFSVKILNNYPVVSWSANFDEGTLFMVQRSENGIDFTSVGSVASKSENKNYSFTDQTLSINHASVMYYRVYAIGQTGNQKYTDIKSVRFEAVAANGTISAYPNPFVSELSIMYTATQKQTITVKVFDFTGQVKYNKQVSANSGSNTIPVTEARKWNSGVYFVQIITANNTAVTSKIVKQ